MGASSDPKKEDLHESDEFRMYAYKVLPCSKRSSHEWTTCPYAHPGEKARRRDPRLYSYLAIPCEATKNGGTCPRGDECPNCHSLFEYWLHPSRYRTQLCRQHDGTQCKRQICFFAHSIEELRVPDPSHLNIPAEMKRPAASPCSSSSSSLGSSPTPSLADSASQPEHGTSKRSSSGSGSDTASSPSRRARGGGSGAASAQGMSLSNGRTANAQLQGTSSLPPPGTGAAAAAAAAAVRSQLRRQASAGMQDGPSSAAAAAAALVEQQYLLGGAAHAAAWRQQQEQALQLQLKQQQALLSQMFAAGAQAGQQQLLQQQQQQAAAHTASWPQPIRHGSSELLGFGAMMPGCLQASPTTTSHGSLLSAGLDGPGSRAPYSPASGSYDAPAGPMSAAGSAMSPGGMPGGGNWGGSAALLRSLSTPPEMLGGGGARHGHAPLGAGLGPLTQGQSQYGSTDSAVHAYGSHASATAGGDASPDMTLAQLLGYGGGSGAAQAPAPPPSSSMALPHAASTGALQYGLLPSSHHLGMQGGGGGGSGGLGQGAATPAGPSHLDYLQLLMQQQQAAQQWGAGGGGNGAELGDCSSEVMGEVLTYLMRQLQTQQRQVAA